MKDTFFKRLGENWALLLGALLLWLFVVVLKNTTSISQVIVGLFYSVALFLVLAFIWKLVTEKAAPGWLQGAAFVAVAATVFTGIVYPELGVAANKRTQHLVNVGHGKIDQPTSGVERNIYVSSSSSADENAAAFESQLAAFDQVIAKAREDLEALEPQVDENGVETADSINARNAAQAKVWRLSTQRKQKEAYTNLCVKVCKAGVVTTETTPTSPVNFVEGRIYQVGNFWFAYDKEVRALRAFEDENALGVYLKPAARVAGLSPAYWASPFVLSYEQAGVVGISPLQISRTEAETLYNRYKEDLKKK